tara:strand:+ start:6249 stop:6845 length:597 start_codon:yes stop_codon:yes gene_type:complete
VFLKKIDKYLLFFFLIKVLMFFPNKHLLSNETKVVEYFNNISEFSSFFLQINDGDISEGNLYFKNNRLRVDYTKPSNILIILAKNKGMYFNKDLDELEYFNPKKSIAEIFFDIFNQKNYFIDAKFLSENNYIKLNKKIIVDKDEKFELILIFEKNPTLLRNIKITGESGDWEYSLSNHNFNPDLNNDFFSMANSKFGQ